MALNIDQLNSITRNKIVPMLYDNIFESNPLLKRMLASGQYRSVSGGTYIDIPLNYAQSTSAGWYNGAATLATADNENLTAARFSWCNLYAAITVSKEDINKNGGDEGVVKLLTAKAQIAESTLKDLLGTGLYSDGTDAQSIQGLDDIIAINQTVGGISQSTYSWWRGQLDSTTTTLTLSAMNSVYESCTVGTDRPSVITTTRANYNRYYNLLQPQQRFYDSDSAKGGFSSLMFNSAPVLVDTHATTAGMYFINEKELWLFYHPSENFSFDDYDSPVNQRVMTGRVNWMGALGSSNNRKHGRLSAITA